MLIPVVLSGGAGTRLWPISREGHPKPFMRLADGESLLEKTYKRAIGCNGVNEVLTITNRDYYFLSKDCWAACSHARIAPRLLLEPAARNTAPALLLGALNIRSLHGEDAVMLVLPADHLIKDATAFRSSVERACELAKHGHIVTFGIRPTTAETGYGYIRAGRATEHIPGSFAVASFIEKPPRDAAEAMVAQGDHYWNSGMFCFRVGDLLAAFERHAPNMLIEGEHCWNISQAKPQNAHDIELDTETFLQLADISIDYAIMEKADNVAMVVANFDWSDIGSWHTLAELAEPDAHGNRIVGEAIKIESHNCFIQSENRMVAALGLDNIMIIDTPDALLVSHRDHVQNVKEVVKQLKEKDHESYKFHRTVSRPWGTYTVLEQGDRYKIKCIVVNPGATLSLQMHHHRSEHWIVVNGMAKVVNGEKEFFVGTNESTYIPAGYRHRLENPGIIALVMIEVQSGEYLEEDDIIRFMDEYGRT